MLACIFKVISEVLGITLTFWLTQIFSQFFLQKMSRFHHNIQQAVYLDVWTW